MLPVPVHVHGDGAGAGAGAGTGDYSISGGWTQTGPLLLSLFYFISVNGIIKDIKRGQFCIGSCYYHVCGMQKQIRCYTIIVGLCSFYYQLSIFIVK